MFCPMKDCMIVMAKPITIRYNTNDVSGIDDDITIAMKFTITYLLREKSS